MATTVGYNDLQNRVIGLGIATGVIGILAGILLQFTRRIRNMPAYFKSNFSVMQGTHPFYLGSRVKPIIATILYYLFLLTAPLLLLIWVILLGVNVGANPSLPVLFTGLFIIVLFLPSYSSFFYVKCLILFILFLTA